MQISRNVSHREKIDQIYAHYEDDIHARHKTIDPPESGLAAELDLNLSDLGDTDLEDLLSDTRSRKSDDDVLDNDSIDFESRNGDADASTKAIIAKSQNGTTTIQNFLATHEGDPAIKVGYLHFCIYFTHIKMQDFLNWLKDHILDRLHGVNSNSKSAADDRIEYTDKERRGVSLAGGRLYMHASLHINYTSYDVHHLQDVVNCTDLDREQCNIMVYADEDGPDSHPFWYARVLRIFHANIIHNDYQNGQHMEFLWVRWFGRDMTYSAGWTVQRLDRIGFVDGQTDCFGFLDPSLAVRACHLIPAFQYGRTQALLGPSKYCHRDGDWRYYYVNRHI